MPVSYNASCTENMEGAEATRDEGAVRRGPYLYATTLVLLLLLHVYLSHQYEIFEISL